MKISRGASLMDCLDTLRDRGREWSTAPEISASMHLDARYQSCRHLATLVSRGMAEMSQLGGQPRRWRITALGAAWPEGRALLERANYRVMVALGGGGHSDLADEDPRVLGTLLRRDVIRRAGDGRWTLDPALLPFARMVRRSERKQGGPSVSVQNASCRQAVAAPADENALRGIPGREWGENCLAGRADALAGNS